ncbi:MAG: alcohol dehydrogenase catalytic domain-containing protein, partial [Pseudomonadota bacterium]
MRAFVVPEHGILEFTDGWDPEGALDDHVNVKVFACGLNFADILMIEGSYQDTPSLPFVPGLEVAGEILSVGPNVTDLQPGDRIAAFCGAGGLAETVQVAADRCRLIPPEMSDTVAAGFQIAYGTSHLALTRRARLQSTDTLVVLGAAGGVGLTAVEIGHTLGARVIAVARGEEKCAIARKAGADE